MLAIFKSIKLNHGGLWGIYAVLPFPDLGNSCGPEEQQGKLLADLAVHYMVELFVLSTALRAGPRNEENREMGKADAKAKRAVEEYVRGCGLRWM
jgi:hypothetical protein